MSDNPNTNQTEDESPTTAGEPLPHDDVARGKRTVTPDGESVRRIYRDPENGMLAGVCAGLAEYFEIDPTLVRIGFIAAALAGGPGILLYIMLWFVIPEKGAVA
jgi:phage shock protein C